ncbi:sensor histidine kinase [Sphingosinicella terrae]|uniref:sensor histidine kinase n=1 Tax=Sphingosinicella terrae TaxID=2172047 RepID=UPI000E0DA996|nr:ATP-binding protein [Sphingosinicella terrae]
MASRDRRRTVARSFGLRTLLAGGLAFLIVEVLAGTEYYATAAVLGGLLALTVWDTARLQSGSPPSSGGADARHRERLQQLDRDSALLDAVSVALIALAPDGRIAFANRAARRLAGEPVRRLTDMAALGPDLAVQILALPAGARRILTLADGRLMLVWVVELVIPGEPAQKLVSLQAVAGELDAVQLRAWQDMSRVLSHEIMNSLTPIASLSESAASLMRGQETAEARVVRAVESVARRSRHLIDFVERYRQVAELPEPSLRPIRAAALVADITALMEADLAGAGVSLRSDVEPPDVTFQGDPELLSQAILNLVRNGAEAAAPAAAPLVSLSCRRIGSELILQVRDSGPGFDPDRLEESFVPFFTTKAGGSGIGLTLARQIALAHGGRLEAANETEGGAVLRMILPIRG